MSRLYTTWKAMQDGIVFEFDIDPESLDATARVYASKASDDVKLIALSNSATTFVELSFNSGVKTVGTLFIKRNHFPDKPNEIEVHGGLEFWDDTTTPSSFFEGTLFALPYQPALTEPDSGRQVAHSMPAIPAGPGAPDGPARDTEAVRRSRAPTAAPHQGQLFPYIYLRQCEPPLSDARRRGFAELPDMFASLPFLTALAKASTAPDREALAVAFISGKDSFAGQFVADPGQLQGLIPLLLTVPALLRVPGHSPAALVGMLSSHFGRTPPQMQACLGAPDHCTSMGRIWQSYFSLVLSPGSGDTRLSALGSLLLTSHLLDYLFNPLLGNALLTRAMLDELLDACIGLPAALFPLAVPDPLAAVGASRALAVGELQTVVHRFLRHTLADVAHIENVMPHERKEISRKRIETHTSADRGQAHTDEARHNQAGDLRQHLQEHTLRSTAEQAVRNQYDDFQTSYGPPTDATLKGSWTEWTLQGKKPGCDDVTRFARDILNRSVDTIAREVSQLRARGSVVHAEESVTSTIDNSQGQHQLVCALRWVDAVHEASVVSVGKRLMIEFILPCPAADYLRLLRGRNPAASMPLPLSQQGVASFADIDRGTYASLAASYEVTDLTPPPAAQKRVSFAVRGGDEKLLPLPPGYCVVSADVGWIGAGGPAPLVLIGSEKFPSDSTGQQRSFGQESELAVAVLTQTPAPAPAPAPVAVAVVAPLVNVSLVCEPTDAMMTEWRIRTYEALLKGYQRQAAQYVRQRQGMDGQARPRRSHQAAREVQKGELRRGCIRFLLREALAHAGAAGHPRLPDPYTLQFLNESCEWDELSARYYDAGVSATDLLDELCEREDDTLAPFLEADAARVMVPVHPGQVQALLYFLGTGRYWSPASGPIPVHEGHVALVHAMKQPEPQQRQDGARTWEVIVPTSMQALDAGFSISAHTAGGHA